MIVFYPTLSEAYVEGRFMSLIEQPGKDIYVGRCRKDGIECAMVADGDGTSKADRYTFVVWYAGFKDGRLRVQYQEYPHELLSG